MLYFEIVERFNVVVVVETESELCFCFGLVNILSLSVSRDQLCPLIGPPNPSFQLSLVEREKSLETRNLKAYKVWSESITESSKHSTLLV